MLPMEQSRSPTQGWTASGPHCLTHGDQIWHGNPCTQEGCFYCQTRPATLVGWALYTLCDYLQNLFRSLCHTMRAHDGVPMLRAR